MLSDENLEAVSARRLDVTLSQLSPPLTHWEKDKIAHEVFRDAAAGATVDNDFVNVAAVLAHPPAVNMVGCVDTVAARTELIGCWA